jgi:hypothetical protein
MSDMYATISRDRAIMKNDDIRHRVESIPLEIIELIELYQWQVPVEPIPYFSAKSSYFDVKPERGPEIPERRDRNGGG